MRSLAAVVGILLGLVCVAFAEDVYYGEAPAPNMRKAKEGECIWSFVDATPVREGLMPGKRDVTVETRTKLCYHGWTYSLTTYQRYVDDRGVEIMPWHAVKSAYDNYSITLWLSVRENDRAAGPPPWGEAVFEYSEKLLK